MRSNMTKGALNSCGCGPAETPSYGLGGTIKKIGKKAKGALNDALDSKILKYGAPALYYTNKALLDGVKLGLGKTGSAESGAGAVSAMTPAQADYFNRPSLQFSWDALRSDASRNGMGLGEFVAKNWNNVSSGDYNTVRPESNLLHGSAPQPMAQPAPQWQQTTPYQQLPQQAGYARGGAGRGLPQGALSSRHVQGPGSGRDDLIDAKVSDGEFVMDAETVSLLGDGSNKEGARRLEQMRQQLRKQKGGALSQGKFSPNAKAPLSYLKGKK